MDASSNDPIAQYEARLEELEKKVRQLQVERQRSTPRRTLNKRFFEKYAIIGIWALVIAVFAFVDSSIYGSSRFFSWANFSTIFGTQGVLVVLTLGLLLPLTAGDFDLSIAATMTLSALIVAITIVGGTPTPIAVILGLVTGAIIGGLNAFFILYFRIHSLIVTLGMATFVIGISKWISGSRTISIFGINPTLIEWVNQMRLFNISMSFWYALILCGLMWYFLEYTTPGRRVLFVGRAREVARLAGIRVDAVRAFALVSCGVIASLAGVLAVGLNGSADPSSRIGLLLPAFAAAFLGATSIVPGRFNPLGSLIGVLLLATGISGLQIFGIPNFVQDLFYGGGLILAVAASQLVRKRQPMEFGS